MTTLDDALAAALYEAGDASLDTGASLLAADPGLDAALRQRGEELIRGAWERGWQPADLLRCVRRDLTEPHLRLLTSLIRSETAKYGELPPRWSAQLGELDGEDWRADRFSYATAVLELYRLLVRLPSIEPVGPVPGQPFLAPTGYEPRMLTRIRALLAKAEATTYPEEAEALTAKAQELMSRHSVDEASLAPKSTTPAAFRIGVDAPYETAKAILLDAVASANRCRAVWNSSLGFSTVVGFEGDLESVELLYTSLLVQGTAAMTRAEGAQRAGGRRRTKTFRQSFLMSYAGRLGERLASAAQSVPAPDDLLPVLATREIAVAAHAEELFPRTTTTRVRGVTDEAGWRHGRAAADNAQVAASRGLLGRSS
ncbi:DUF2786 domain-containing protein [Streptomyces albipurpureus]|uniref:DUF2786 domain-containing protein n=1 Tax=Streptomyces albipurpureus TaxID=2897419 RepID=A0ABT0URA1_9ACTN|nr:DUF2786 domain-containing protein [Streptomyces sp. CWNU-1]MCM2391137.1 DUF2786 domain-containing protein [Streptomyces sp. CWNU-1]